MSMTKPTSEQVTFLAAGSGATQRTALDKLRDVVSVKDFGAAGDGTADDTAEIQAALDAVPAIGGCVYFPAGTYVVSAPLVVDSNTVLVGDGMYVSKLSATTAFTSSQASGMAGNLETICQSLTPASPNLCSLSP